MDIELPKDLDTVTKHASKQPCLNCGRGLDATSGDTNPKAGDITLCAHCANVMIFTEDLKFRMPTPEEQVELDNSAELQEIRKITLMAMEERRGLQ